MQELIRCDWPSNNSMMIDYHDKEWGVPLHEDDKLFEFMILDAFQAGLSWSIILKKRESMRKAFDDFKPEIISEYKQDKIDLLLADASIIRNKMKIEATVQNARQFLEMKAKYGSFDSFIWDINNGRRVINNWKILSEIPTKTELSDKMSKLLKDNGFKFVGTTICYAFMQAIGMVNDHLIKCFRYNELL
jgi:DNA-3-methyladenine glycosylase I